MGHDRNVLGHLLQLLQLVAGDQETFPLVGQAAEQGDRFLPADRVHAAERFVEDQQFRVVDEGLRSLMRCLMPLE